MRYASVDDEGRLLLGDQAERLGFVTGAVVQIIPTSAGSLLVVLDHGHSAYDGSWKPLVGGAAQLARRQSQREQS